MQDEKKLDRREFTTRSLMAALAGVAVSVSACGGGGGAPAAAGPTGASPMPSDDGSGDASTDVSGVISSNHGHTATITAAQLGSGGMITLNIRGNSNHPHTVELSAAEVATIAGGGRVSVRSSNEDGHSHDVSFN